LVYYIWILEILELDKEVLMKVSSKFKTIGDSLEKYYFLISPSAKDGSQRNKEESMVEDVCGVSGPCFFARPEDRNRAFEELQGLFEGDEITAKAIKEIFSRYNAL